MLAAPSSTQFYHLPPSIKDKIVLLLQSNNFIEARQLYNQAVQKELIEKRPFSRNDDYYE